MKKKTSLSLSPEVSAILKDLARQYGVNGMSAAIEVAARNEARRLGVLVPSPVQRIGEVLILSDET